MSWLELNKVNDIDIITNGSLIGSLYDVRPNNDKFDKFLGILKKDGELLHKPDRRGNNKSYSPDTTYIYSTPEIIGMFNKDIDKNENEISGLILVKID